MSIVNTFMQAQATANLYNSSLARQYATMGQLSLLNNVTKLVPPANFGIRFGNASTSSLANGGDTFTRSVSASSEPKAGDTSFLPQPVLTSAMDQLAKVAQKSKGLALLTMFSSMWQQFYKVMLNALGKKPPSDSPAKTSIK
jgi:hypothetical protein